MTLSKNERIELRGFGTFAVKHRLPKKARNPKTGDPVYLPERYVPVFKPSKLMKTTVNDKLIDRGTRIISELTGLDYTEAQKRLFSAEKSVKVAVVMEILQCSVNEARERLENVDGFLYSIIDTQK